MQIKTFRGKTLSEVMARIKKEIGPDAVILNSDDVTDKGEKYFEVTVARENDIEQQKREPNYYAYNFEQEFRLEWEKFQKNIYALIKPHLNKNNITPRQKQVLDYLEKQGVSTELILEIYARISQSPDTPILKILSQAIKIQSWMEKFTPQKIHAFTGPSGSGQTSTSLRLALELKKSSAKILILNANINHAGGKLYLKHFSELSGLAYHETDRLSRSILNHFKEFDYILIDLPPLAQGKNLLASMKELQASSEIAIHLVLAPAYSSEQLNFFSVQYSHPQMASLIWTKLDETCIFGRIMNIAWKTRLPISYLSYGPGLKKSSVPATQDNVWRLIFKKELPNGCKIITC